MRAGGLILLGLLMAGCASAGPRKTARAGNPYAMRTKAPLYVHAKPTDSPDERDRLYRAQKVSYDGSSWILGRKKVSLEALQDFVRAAPHTGFDKKLKDQALFIQGVDIATHQEPDSYSPVPLLYGAKLYEGLRAWYNPLDWASYLVGRGVSAAAWMSIESDVKTVNAGILKDLGADPVSELGLRPPLPEPWPAKVGPLWDREAEAYDRQVHRPFIGSVRHQPEEIEDYMRALNGGAEITKMRQGDRDVYWGNILFGAGVTVIMAICLDQLFHFGNKYYDPAIVAPVGTVAGLTALGGWALEKSGRKESAEAEETFNARFQPRPSVPPLPPSADAAIRRGDFRQALLILHRVHRESGESAPLLRQMGECYFQLKDMPNALICYKRALALSPGDEKSANMVRALEAARP
jgi:tetratricopeptide (TPR) repeat protein